MNVEIHDCDPLRAMRLLRVAGGAGDIVEETKAHRRRRLGMMAGRTHGDESIRRPAGHHFIHSLAGRAGGVQGRFPGAGAHGGVAVELDDAFATGSSIMPQKKNPDVAELIRGKTGRVFGHLMGMLTVGKGLPLAYNKDLQEDKEGLFDTVDTVGMILAVLPPMLRSTTFRTDRMATAAADGFALATDVADHLVRLGMPFREAHAVVGRAVGYCVLGGKGLADLTPEEWARFSPMLASSPPPLTVDAALQAREVPGGTGPRQVATARRAARRRLDDWFGWISARRAAIDAVEESLGIRKVTA